MNQSRGRGEPQCWWTEQSAATRMANLGRQQAGTDPQIDQLVTVQSDLLTQMQNMASMMGRFVNSIIPALHPGNSPRSYQTQQPRQLFDPYPGQDRRSYQNSGVGRYGVKSQVPRGNCYACGQPGHFAKDTLPGHTAPRRPRTI